MSGVSSSFQYGRPLTGDELRRAAAKLRKSFIAARANQTLNAGGPPLINPATGLPFPGMMVWPSTVDENLAIWSSTDVVREAPAAWGIDPQGMGGSLLIETTDEGGGIDRRIVAVQKPLYFAAGQWSSMTIKTLTVANPNAPIYSLWTEVTPVGGIPTELPAPVWRYAGAAFTTVYLIPQGAIRVRALGPVVLTWLNWSVYAPSKVAPPTDVQTLAAGDTVDVDAGVFRVDRDVALQFLLRPL